MASFGATRLGFVRRLLSAGLVAILALAATGTPANEMRKADDHADGTIRLRAWGAPASGNGETVPAKLYDWTVVDAVAFRRRASSGHPTDEALWLYLEDRAIEVPQRVQELRGAEGFGPRYRGLLLYVTLKGELKHGWFGHPNGYVELDVPKAKFELESLTGVAIKGRIVVDESTGAEKDGAYTVDVRFNAQIVHAP